MMVAHLSEYTKYHGFVPFNWVNFMIREFVSVKLSKCKCIRSLILTGVSQFSAIGRVLGIRVLVSGQLCRSKYVALDSGGELL